MTRRKKSLSSLIGSLAIGAILMSGCTPTPAGESAADEPPVKDAAADAPAPSATPDMPPTPEVNATESFLAWLEASRVPETDAACAQLTPKLVDRMLTEMQSEGFAEVSTCEEMITVTAELYRAFDQSADVDVAVQSETVTDAVLFVTYLASGDCGTVVMERAASTWVLTELTEECA